MPCELPGIRERLEIRDGPLVSVGTAGANEVAEQMQMEADEDECRGKPGVRGQVAALNRRAKGEGGQRAGDEECRHGADQRKSQRVQGMVILGKPQQWMRRIPGQKLGHNAKAIDIRRHGSGDHQRFFSPGERGGLAAGRNRGQQPSGKEMSDRTQGAILPQITQNVADKRLRRSARTCYPDG